MLSLNMFHTFSQYINCWIWACICLSLWVATRLQVIEQWPHFYFTHLLSRHIVTNPFLANVPNLSPLKTPENLWVSGVLRGVWIGNVDQKLVNDLTNQIFEIIYFVWNVLLKLDWNWIRYDRNIAILHNVEKWPNTL